jgi:hypothetical protein
MAKQNRRWWAAGWSGAGCLLLLMLAFVTPIGWIWIPQLWSDFRNKSELSRNRELYESLVLRIDRDLAPGERSATYLHADRVEDLKPIDLSVMDASEVYELVSTRRMITARRSVDGNLRIRFGTYDLHHAGVWSLVYFSGSMSDEEMNRTIGPGGATRVDTHWWAVMEWP